MTQSILVLEENLNIQGLISSSLKTDDLSIFQESNPEMYAKQALELRPDLIFLSNSDSNDDYQACREIRKERELENTPVILLANARDQVDDEIINTLEISGLLRKPFEASKLHEQLRKYISFDEEAGKQTESDEIVVEMKSIHDDLNGLMQEKSEPSASEESEIQTSAQEKRPDQGTEMMRQNSQASRASVKGSDMDSMLLDETMEGMDLSSEDLADEQALEDIESLDEEELELSLDLDEPELEAIEEEPALGGLEKLKDSGLEDRFAHNSIMDDEEAEFALELSDAVDEGLDDFEVPALYEEDLDLSASDELEDEDNQTLREGLTDIDLSTNDMEPPQDMWDRPPNLAQQPREGLTDINLENNDFDPVMPKKLAELQKAESELEEEYELEDPDENQEINQEMDLFLLEPSAAESGVQLPNPMDILLLTDSDQASVDDSMSDPGQYLMETSGEELADDFDMMPNQSVLDEEPADDFSDDSMSEDDGLEELEDLNLQMDSLEEEAIELQEDEAEFQQELELEEKIALEEDLINEETFEENAAEFDSALDFEEELEAENATDESKAANEMSAGETSAEWDESKEELREFMIGELGNLLEDDDEELESITESDTEELREFMMDQLGDLLEDDDEEDEPGIEEQEAATEPAVEEEVFATWDDAEDAFMEFDREPEEPEELEPITEPAVEEEVFATWDDAEDAFMVFDREATEDGSEPIAEEEKIDASVQEEVFEDWDDAEGAFLEHDREEVLPQAAPGVTVSTTKLTEEELTNIVTHSVQKALEGSISTLVKQVVTELKEREEK